MWGGFKLWLRFCWDLWCCGKLWSTNRLQLQCSRRDIKTFGPSFKTLIRISSWWYCHGNRGLTHSYKTGLYGEQCLLFINSSQESYISDVGLNPTECWPLTHPLTLRLHPMGLKRGRCRKPNDGPDRLWYHVTNNGLMPFSLLFLVYI